MERVTFHNGENGFCVLRAPLTTLRGGPYFCITRLVLLCHKLALWQQGQRGSRRAMLRANLMRRLAIDAVTWRSVRIGGSAGSVTRG